VLLLLGLVTQRTTKHWTTARRSVRRLLKTRGNRRLPKRRERIGEVAHAAADQRLEEIASLPDLPAAVRVDEIESSQEEESVSAVFQRAAKRDNTLPVAAKTVILGFAGIQKSLLHVKIEDMPGLPTTWKEIEWDTVSFRKSLAAALRFMHGLHAWSTVKLRRRGSLQHCFWGRTPLMVRRTRQAGWPSLGAMTANKVQSERILAASQP
jgi:hypothetical protein